MKAHSGNSQDSKTLKNLVKSHISSLKAAQKCHYLIGDSALYVAETTKTLSEQNQYFITRVPQKIIEAKALLANLDTLSFTEMDNGYSGCFVESDYAGVRQKWLVVHSQQANKREQNNLEKRIEKSMETSQKTFKKLCSQLFSCQSDALKALEQWETQQDYARTDTSAIEEVIKHEGPGRPSPNVPGTILYKITGTLKCSKTQKQKAQSMLGIFILATNDLSAHLDMQSMLSNYKSQQKVEGGFRFLKSPDFLTSSLFLKKPERIETLLMVMTCCLMVYAALEHLIRKKLKQDGSYFPNMKNKPCQNPTTRWIFYNFQGIHELVIKTDKMHIIINNLEQKHLIVLKCLGPIYEKLYSGI